MIDIITITEEIHIIFFLMMRDLIIFLPTIEELFNYLQFHQFIKVIKY